MASRKKTKLEIGLKRVVNAYRNNCRRKNIFWGLKEEDLKELIFKNCHYCGAKPSNKSCYVGSAQSSNYKVPYFIYNGLDRINHNKGYTKKNVITCCARCNSMRSDHLSVDEMKEVGKVLAAHRDNPKKT